MDLVHGDIQSNGQGPCHPREPLRPGLRAHVFRDHRVAGIVIHHGAHILDVPVIQAKTVYTLAPEPF